MEAYLKELESGLGTVIQRLQEDLRGVRSNRPSVQLVEDVKVDYYGQPLTVKELGSLSIRPPRDVVITVWDKNAVGAVTKGIESANAGLSVTNDGNTVYASLPPLTDERRAEIAKLVKKMTEEAKIQIRNRRDEALKRLKSAEEKGELTEDDLFKAKERAEKSVGEANKKAESFLDGKLKELNE